MEPLIAPVLDYVCSSSRKKGHLFNGNYNTKGHLFNGNYNVILQCRIWYFFIQYSQREQVLMYLLLLKNNNDFVKRKLGLSERL